MEYLENLKHTLCKELKPLSEKSNLSMSDLELIHKLTDTIKNVYKILIMEEQSGGSSYRGGSSSYRGGSSYGDDDMSMYSERGRGRNAKRDSIGRYAEYSEEGGGSSYNEYSRESAKDRMMSGIGEMMRSADSEQRRILEKCMKELERA